MTALDWVFVAHILLALALALGWLDAPVLLARRARRRPARGASEIRHPAMRATRTHLTAHPLPRQRTRKDGDS
ncbi:hypothetical protein [Streptomyces scabiei]|uniref:hypothetical protein n=1 Tax=Streptomyces scabiei TaxID=1930 RepID=UPI0004E77C71|nr:hypothetical protein [Streptomyces scabiei]KFG08132.1 hypothetical protein IQ61_15485 [Streptomyces scabiei]MDX3681406.1 hypothetical protein [Streptomyces scabiei]